MNAHFWRRLSAARDAQRPSRRFWGSGRTDYMRALPALGAAVTVVKDTGSTGPGVFFCQGFGLTGRCDKVCGPA
jgi:hypothetical protein